MKTNKNLKSKKIIDILRVHNITTNTTKAWWGPNSDMNSGGGTP